MYTPRAYYNVVVVVVVVDRLLLADVDLRVTHDPVAG